MKKLIFLLPFLLILSGCEEMKGILTVKKAVVLHDHNNLDVTISPENYDIKITLDKDKSRFAVEVDFKQNVPELGSNKHRVR